MREKCQHLVHLMISFYMCENRGKCLCLRRVIVQISLRTFLEHTVKIIIKPLHLLYREQILLLRKLCLSSSSKYHPDEDRSRTHLSSFQGFFFLTPFVYFIFLPFLPLLIPISFFLFPHPHHFSSGESYFLTLENDFCWAVFEPYWDSVPHSMCFEPSGISGQLWRMKKKMHMRRRDRHQCQEQHHYFHLPKPRLGPEDGHQSTS